VETGIAVKLDAGAVVAAGSTIARNFFTGWAHPASTNAYDASGGTIAVFCEQRGTTGTATGGPLDCATAKTPPPISHGLSIEKNQIRGGFRGGIMVSLANRQAGEAYAVRIINNMVTAGDRNFGNPQSAALWLFKNSAGIQVSNNTFRCEKGSAGGGAGVDVGHDNTDPTPTAGPVQAEFRNNIFDFAGCTQKIVDVAGGAGWREADNLCDTAIPGRCRGGAGTLTFLNEAAGDLHLAPIGNLAAVDKGSALAGFADDIDGVSRPQGPAWDIGAHEVGLGPVPPVLLSVEPE